MANSGRLHVAVGVLFNNSGELLIAKRLPHAHQGGRWEFPGGKVEAGESVFEALRRELCEELGLEISAAEPLLQIAHDYDDKSVLLDVWRVLSFSGEAAGVEGQALRWVSIESLAAFRFPAANLEIIEFLQRDAAVLP